MSIGSVLQTWSQWAVGKQNTDQIAFVGISDLSVHVELRDGTRYRIVNPDFMKGLEIKEVKPGDDDYRTVARRHPLSLA